MQPQPAQDQPTSQPTDSVQQQSQSHPQSNLSQPNSTARPGTHSSKRPQKKNKKTIWIVAAVVSALALIGAGGYAASTILLTPTRVKEQAIPAYEVFEDHYNTTQKIGEELLDEGSSGSTADSIERQLNKAKDLLEEEEEARQQLQEHLERMSVGALNQFEDNLKTYLEDSKEIAAYQQEMIATFEGYIEPLKTIEELSVQGSGMASYLYSDPDKYVELLTEYRDDQQAAIDKIAAVEPDEKMKEMHEAFVEMMQGEIQFLDDMKQAVEDRDEEAISEASRGYAERSHEVEKKYERISDEMDEKIEDILDQVKDRAGDVEQEYQALQRQYDF